MYSFCVLYYKYMVHFSQFYCFFRPAWEEALLPFQAEVSWRLGQWDKLDASLQSNTVSFK